MAEQGPARVGSGNGEPVVKDMDEGEYPETVTVQRYAPLIFTDKARARLADDALESLAPALYRDPGQPAVAGPGQIPPALQAFAIGAEGHAMNWNRVTFESESRLPGLRIPDLHRTVE